MTSALPPQLRLHGYELVNGGTNASELRANLNKAADEIEQQAQTIARLTHDLEESRKDWMYHRDCRPNRQQAEAWRADAKAMNDKWADKVKARREAEETIARLEEERDKARKEAAAWQATAEFLAEHYPKPPR